MESHRHLLALITPALLIALTFLPRSAGAAEPSAADRARAFITEHEATVRPLDKATALSSWEAQATGKDEAYKRAEERQNQLDAAYADPAKFARLKQIREDFAQANPKPDPLLKRQIDLLYLDYLSRQLDPELLKRITAKSTAITQAFNVYRAKVDGKELADSEVRQILHESRDSAYRRKVWEAGKAVGGVVEADLKQLVALRNQAARKLGFSDYYDMQMQLGELTRERVIALFDELHGLMREPFKAAKAEIDAHLAKEDYGIEVADLRPWHYQDPFFQEAPATYKLDLDTFYAGQDIVKLSADFFRGIGLAADDVIARSDLFERPGKYPHAMCMDIDREGDVRVMANVVPNEYWMGTMLHELGHAVYDVYFPRSLPYVVRMPAHSFTTEGVAMLFERLSQQAGWMEGMGLNVPDPKAVTEVGRRMHRDKTLIFAAWAQVMVRFESAMYQNPEQDLNALWWDLVEKYQMVRRPEGRNAPDYASKIHVVSSPAYYHSYMMGELFAAQLYRSIRRDVLKTDERIPRYDGRKEIGEYMKARVFGPGATLRWDEYVRFATGEELSPRALMEELQAQ